MCGLTVGKLEVSMQRLNGHSVFSSEAHLGKRSSKRKFICFSEISKLASLGRGISQKQLNKMGHRRQRNDGSSVNVMDKKSFKTGFI